MLSIVIIPFKQQTFQSLLQTFTATWPENFLIVSSTKCLLTNIRCRINPLYPREDTENDQSYDLLFSRKTNLSLSIREYEDTNDGSLPFHFDRFAVKRRIFQRVLATRVYGSSSIFLPIARALATREQCRCFPATEGVCLEEFHLKT